MKKLKALICGVSGQDGAYLAQLLLGKGYAVIGTSRDRNMANSVGLTFLGIKDQVPLESMSISDFQSVLQVIRKIQPDEIYNLAGQSSVSLSFQQPLEALNSIAVGTLNILEAIRLMDKGIKFYNAGSGECFGNTNGIPADENTRFHPQSPYAVAKATSFWQVTNYREAYKLFACSGILFNHESPLRPEHFVTRKIISAVCRITAGSEERLKLGNLQVSRDWGWAPEYVHAMWLMLQQSQPQDFVIATGETRKLEDFVSRAFSCAGKDWRDYVDVDPGLMRPSDILIGCGNPEKAHQVLKWKAHNKLDDIIPLMIDAEKVAIRDRSAGIYPKLNLRTELL